MGFLDLLPLNIGFNIGTKTGQKLAPRVIEKLPETLSLQNIPSTPTEFLISTISGQSGLQTYKAGRSLLPPQVSGIMERAETYGTYPVFGVARTLQDIGVPLLKKEGLKKGFESAIGLKPSRTLAEFIPGIEKHPVLKEIAGFGIDVGLTLTPQIAKSLSPSMLTSKITRNFSEKALKNPRYGDFITEVATKRGTTPEQVHLGIQREVFNRVRKMPYPQRLNLALGETGFARIGKEPKLPVKVSYPSEGGYAFGELIRKEAGMGIIKTLAGKQIKIPLSEIMKQEPEVKLSVPEEVKPLIEEAKKYKTVEEFVEAQFEKPIYGMVHRPTYEDMPFAYDLLQGEAMPRDIYEHPEFTGADMKAKTYQESWDVIQKIRNKPDVEVTVYRASPKKELNYGDWITFSKEYAKLSAEKNEKVFSYKIKAKDAIFAGDDLNEFGYYPKSHLTSIWQQAQAEKGIKPEIPPSVMKPRQVKKVIKEATGLAKFPEQKALKAQLRLEAKVAKTTFKAGYQEARANLLGKLKIRQANIAQVKSDIANYVTENLPTALHGKFLNAVKTAITQKNLTKAFMRVDRLAEAYYRKQFVKEILDTSKQVADSPSIAVEYKSKIKTLIDGIQFKGVSEVRKTALQKTLDYIRSQEALGKEVEMPKRMLKQLLTLSKKPIQELTFRELAVLKDEINLLETLGRTKLKARQEIYNFEKERKAQEIYAGTVNLDKYLEIKPGIGEELTGKQKLRNLYARLLNEAQRIDLAISPADVLFDIMDGSKGTYNGPNFRYIKAPTDINFGRYLDLKDSIQKPLIDLTKELGLTDSNFERIGVYAVKVQENGIEKLQNSGYTLEEINSVVLTDSEMKWYNEARKVLDKLRPQIAEIMRTVYNLPMGEVKNYFSFMTDWQAMDEAEVYQRIGNLVEEYGHPTKNPELGFTKTRVGPGKQKVLINAFDVFMRHTDNATYLINMARDSRMLFEIINSDRYREVAGARGQKLILEWIDLISRKGGSYGQRQIKIIDTLRKNVAIGVLGFKITSALVQPTSLLDGASYIGSYAFKGASNILDKDWYNMVMRFPEIRKRIGDDPIMQIGGKTLWEKIQQNGMFALKYLDKLTAISITTGAYEKRMIELGLPIDFENINLQAMQYAQFVLRRTQTSAFFKDLPLAISKGMLTGNRSLDRAIFTFQTFMLNRWSIIRHDIWQTGLKEKNYKQALGKAFWLVLATMAGVGIRQGYYKTRNWLLRKDEGDSRFWSTVVSEYLQVVPFVGQLAGSFMYGSMPVPILETIQRGVEAGRAIVMGKKPVTKAKGFLRFMAVGGRLAGVPGVAEVSSWIFGLLREEPSWEGRGKAIRSQYIDLMLQGKDDKAFKLWDEWERRYGDKYYKETGKVLREPNWLEINKKRLRREKKEID